MRVARGGKLGCRRQALELLLQQEPAPPVRERRSRWPQVDDLCWARIRPRAPSGRCTGCVVLTAARMFPPEERDYASHPKSDPGTALAKATGGSPPAALHGMQHSRRGA